MDKNTIDRLKQSGIISQLEDLMVTLGDDNRAPVKPRRIKAQLTSFKVDGREFQPMGGLAEQIAAMREPAAEDAPATTADERAAKRTMAKLTGNIQSIDQAELDRLLAPYIRYGLLRTIYTATTRATEYRGPSGKLIAISIRHNHYRTRDAVLGSTPLALHQQFVGRIHRAAPYELVNPMTGEVVGSGTIPGIAQIIQFPGGAA